MPATISFLSRNVNFFTGRNNPSSWRNIQLENRKGELQLNNKIEELTLLLLYMTAWDEDAPPLGVHKRSWKEHSFTVLKQLEEDGLIVDSNKSKSVFLTSQGAVRAQNLLKKYLGDSANLLPKTVSGT